MTEQQLTQKIIKNAKQQAATLVASAESQAHAKLADAEQQAAARHDQAIVAAKQRLADRQAQQARADEVTLIKARINAQQAVLDTAFKQAREQIVNAPADQTKALVNGWVQQYAHAGDQIAVASEWGALFPDYSTTTAVSYGIVITNDVYRMELTVDEKLNELREQMALPLAQQLGVM